MKQIAHCLLLALALGAVSCSSDPVAVELSPEEIEAARRELEQAMTAPPPPDQDPVQAARQALQNDDYHTATAALVRMGHSPQPLDMKRSIEYDNAMADLQVQLAAAAARGDPRAAAAIEFLRATRR